MIRGTSDAKIPESFGTFMERLFYLWDAEKAGRTVDTGNPTEAFDRLCLSVGEHPSEMREELEDLV